MASFPPDRAKRGEWTWGGKSKAQPTLRWYCPPGAGQINLELSPMVLGAINLEVLSAHVVGAPPHPFPTARSVVRCVGARHTGYELAVVTHGAILFTMSNTPFPDEERDERPDFPKALDHRVYGPGDVATFDSGFYHRAEFLGSYSRVVSFNIARSVMLYDKVAVDDRADHGSP